MDFRDDEADLRELLKQLFYVEEYQKVGYYYLQKWLFSKVKNFEGLQKEHSIWMILKI